MTLQEAIALEPPGENNWGNIGTDKKNMLSLYRHEIAGAKPEMTVAGDTLASMFGGLHRALAKVGVIRHVIVDIGAGSGQVADLLRDLKLPVATIGVDGDAKQIASARSNLQGRRGEPQFVHDEGTSFLRGLNSKRTPTRYLDRLRRVFVGITLIFTSGIMDSEDEIALGHEAGKVLGQPGRMHPKSILIEAPWGNFDGIFGVDITTIPEQANAQAPWALSRTRTITYVDDPLHPDSPPQLMVQTERGFLDEANNAGGPQVQFITIKDPNHYHAFKQTVVASRTEAGLPGEVVLAIHPEGNGRPLFLVQLLPTNGQARARTLRRLDRLGYKVLVEGNENPSIPKRYTKPLAQAQHEHAEGVAQARQEAKALDDQIRGDGVDPYTGQPQHRPARPVNDESNIQWWPSNVTDITNSSDPRRFAIQGEAVAAWQRALTTQYQRGPDAPIARELIEAATRLAGAYWPDLRKSPGASPRKYFRHGTSYQGLWLPVARVDSAEELHDRAANHELVRDNPEAQAALARGLAPDGPRNPLSINDYHGHIALRVNRTMPAGWAMGIFGETGDPTSPDSRQSLADKRVLATHHGNHPDLVPLAAMHGSAVALEIDPEMAERGQQVFPYDFVLGDANEFSDGPAYHLEATARNSWASHRGAEGLESTMSAALRRSTLTIGETFLAPTNDELRPHTDVVMDRQGRPLYSRTLTALETAIKSDGWGETVWLVETTGPEGSKLHAENLHHPPKEAITDAARRLQAIALVSEVDLSLRPRGSVALLPRPPANRPTTPGEELALAAEQYQRAGGDPLQVFYPRTIRRR